MRLGGWLLANRQFEYYAPMLQRAIDAGAQLLCTPITNPAGVCGPPALMLVMPSRPYAANMLRSIQAVFSCTCIRWVSRSALGSSPA